MFDTAAAPHDFRQADDFQLAISPREQLMIGRNRQVRRPIDDIRMLKLIERIAEKDQFALAEFITVTSSDLFAIAFAILKDVSESEDILQEAYFRVWKSAPRYQYFSRPPRFWFEAITRNLAIDRRRVASRTDLDEDGIIALQLIDPEPSPLQQLETSERSKLILAMVNKLSPLEAEAIRIAFFEDIPYAKVAKRLHLPLGTAKSVIRRSLESMRHEAMQLSSEGSV